jgi:hypothetical protein
MNLIANDDWRPKGGLPMTCILHFLFLNSSILHNKYIRDKKPVINDIVCSYVGYICPHPLKSKLIIRITLEDQKNRQVFVQFLEANCRLIVDELLEIKSVWNKFIQKK